MSIKRRLARFEQTKDVYYRWFVCAACLPVSLIMYVPISELNAQQHFSMNLNSPRFLDIKRALSYPSECTCLISIDRSYFAKHEKWNLHFINNMF